MQTRQMGKRGGFQLQVEFNFQFPDSTFRGDSGGCSAGPKHDHIGSCGGVMRGAHAAAPVPARAHFTSAFMPVAGVGNPPAPVAVPSQRVRLRVTAAIHRTGAPPAASPPFQPPHPNFWKPLEKSRVQKQGRTDDTRPDS